MPCVFVAVCNNASKRVLITLQFVHVQTGQTPKERFAVIKVATHQGISCQDSSLISQILSNPRTRVAHECEMRPKCTQI